MAQDVQKIAPDAVTPMGKDGKLAIRGYAGGTPFVQPSLAAFVPPSSPGVAKGIGAMSAFRPPVKFPRGATSSDDAEAVRLRNIGRAALIGVTFLTTRSTIASPGLAAAGSSPVG